MPLGSRVRTTMRRDPARRRARLEHRGQHRVHRVDHARDVRGHRRQRRVRRVLGARVHEAVVGGDARVAVAQVDRAPRRRLRAAHRALHLRAVRHVRHGVEHAGRAQPCAFGESASPPPPPSSPRALTLGRHLAQPLLVAPRDRHRRPVRCVRLRERLAQPRRPARDQHVPRLRPHRAPRERAHEVHLQLRFMGGGWRGAGLGRVRAVLCHAGAAGAAAEAPTPARETPDALLRTAPAHGMPDVGAGHRQALARWFQGCRSYLRVGLKPS